MKDEFLTLKDNKLLSRWENIVIAARKTPHYETVKLCVLLGKYLDQGVPVQMACHDTIINYTQTLESQWAQLAGLMDFYHPRGKEVADYTKELFKAEMQLGTEFSGWFKTINHISLVMQIVKTNIMKLERKKGNSIKVGLSDLQNILTTLENVNSYLDATKEKFGMISNKEMDDYFMALKSSTQIKLTKSKEIVYKRLVSDYQTQLKKQELEKT
ncbi:MAG: hypothetical protein V3U54_12810 [Thermodesulfobacteriota bacterium]